jgi:hypothetical protein
MEKVIYILEILNASFVLGLIDDAEKMLSKHLLFRGDETLPAIDLYSWNDNQNNHQTGHYFTKDTETHKEAQKRMMNVLQQSPRWCSMMEHNGDDLQFNAADLENYETWDIRFRRMLFILIAITCGLSGRGPEMMSLKYMNSISGDRNFILMDGQFMSISEYHKSQAIMDALKV